MTLGERIRQLRLEKELSQEGLADELGVSRQAVSKWEKDLSRPDTENLLALAALFGVSADELALQRMGCEAPAKKRANPALIILILVPALLLLLATGWLIRRASDRDQTDNVTPSSTPGVSETLVPGTKETADPHVSDPPAPVKDRPTAQHIGEFALIWETETRFDYLSVTKPMEEAFPFGTSLLPSEREQVLDTDFGSVKLHRVACGPLDLEYSRITEGGSARDRLNRVDVIVPGYATPRGVEVGSDLADVVAAYGDDGLVYLLKESGDDILCVHDCRYVHFDTAGNAVIFYLSGGHVAGIRIRAGDELGGEAFAVDHISSFPVVNGQPDFSGRDEPEKEAVDDTRAVFIALYALQNDANLSAQERYEHRQTIYRDLSRMSWRDYGLLGEAGKEDDTRLELLDWLRRQDTLSTGELRGLLLGACGRTDLDGWVTESYMDILARAFAAYPVEYTECLAEDAFTEAERQQLITATIHAGTAEDNLRRKCLEAAELAERDSLAFSEAARPLALKILAGLKT